MAKGNPFWAKQTGKLGETVLAVVKGEQVQRAYNPEPVNPRSKGQTGQRIIFSSAVKFFKSAISKQFKFAFEDKKQKESDYNAFMRHNTKNGMIITRDQYLNPNFPSIGMYLLSKGSLKPVKYTTASQGDDSFSIPYDKEYDEAPTTTQELASRIALNNNLINGDIITFVVIETRANGITTKPETPPKWNIYQIKVGDSTDERSVDEILPTADINDGDIEIGLGSSFASGLAVIFSRPTSGGLLVSDGQLMLNSVAYDILEVSQDPTYKKEALASWGMETQAVLQGSLLPNS